MVTDIQVKVENKVASNMGAPVIICGNSDYTVTFTFDAEWATMDIKTARFVYRRGDAFRFIDVVFSGRVVAVPVLSDVDEVLLGVYAGELHTTTPTRIPCKRSILCESSEPYEAPAEDVYAQLMETINNLETLPTVSTADAGKALMVREDGHWVVECPDFMHDVNSGKLVRFFFGTFEEWEHWTGDKTDVLFVPTDDNTLEEICAIAEGAEEKAAQAEARAEQLQASLDALTQAFNEMQDSLRDNVGVPADNGFAWAGTCQVVTGGNIHTDVEVCTADKSLLGVPLDIMYHAKDVGRGRFRVRFAPGTREASKLLYFRARQSVYEPAAAPYYDIAVYLKLTLSEDNRSLLASCYLYVDGEYKASPYTSELFKDDWVEVSRVVEYTAV